MDSIKKEITDAGDNELYLKISKIQLKYLPFIREMMKRVEGSALQLKWKMMHDLIVVPKKKLTLERLQSVETMLEGLKSREESKLLDLEPHEDRKESEQKFNGTKMDEIVNGLEIISEQVKTPDLPEIHEPPVHESCEHCSHHNEHSYARSSNDVSSPCELESIETNKSAIETEKEDNECEDEVVNRLVIDDSSTVVNKKIDESTVGKEEILKHFDKNLTETIETDNVLKSSSPQSLTENISTAISVVKRKSENRDIQSMRNELSRLSSSSSHWEEIDSSLSRRKCFIKQIESGRQSEDIARPCSVFLDRLDPETISKYTKNDFASTTLPKTFSVKQKMTARKRSCLPNSNTHPMKKQRLERSIVVTEPKNTLSKVDDDSDGEDFGEGWEKLKAEEKNDETIIPYQCVLPPPTDIFQLWIYKSICSIAFAKSRRGFIYKCLINGCRFQTLVKETLFKHLTAKHNDQGWNGYCNICTKVVCLKVNRMHVVDEFEHMEAHINSLELVNSAAANDTDDQNVNNTVNETLNQKKIISKSDSIQNLPLKLPNSVNEEPVTEPLIELVPPVLPTKHSSVKNIKSEAQKSSKTNVDKLAQLIPIETKVQPNSKISEKIPDILRPWLKTGNIKMKHDKLSTMMQSFEALSAMYKCMSSSCSFFTSECNLFIKHLRFHEKFTASDRENYLKCAYCEFAGNSIDHLMQHIDSEHAYDFFQCQYCFYRSCTDFNVLTHQNIFHNEKLNGIIECPKIRTRRENPDDMEFLKKSREQNVNPIVCVFCRGIIFNIKTFLDHLTKHDANLKARCITCGEITSSKTLHSHLDKCHRIGLYHCVYCKMGTNDFKHLNAHMANVHPSKIPIFCERSENRNTDGILKHSSPSIIDATIMKNIKQFVNQACLKKAPTDHRLMRNEENVGKLKDGLHIHKFVNENKKGNLSQAEDKQKPVSHKIVAQMPVAKRSITTIMSDLLKPL